MHYCKRSEFSFTFYLRLRHQLMFTLLCYPININIYLIKYLIMLPILIHASKSHKSNFIIVMTSSNLFVTSQKIKNIKNISKTKIDRTLKLKHLKSIVKQYSNLVLTQNRKKCHYAKTWTLILFKEFNCS